MQTDRATDCRSVQQVPLSLKTDEDHGWVTFPTRRPVSDLLTALGGADIPAASNSSGEHGDTPPPPDPPRKQGVPMAK